MGLILKIAGGVLLAVLISFVACGALISSSVDEVDSVDDVIPGDAGSRADDTFLMSIRPSYEDLNDEQLVERGRQVCQRLDEGQDGMTAADGDPALLGAAVGAYCTEHFDKI